MRIVTFPDPVLRKKADPVPEVTDGVRDTLRTMHATMVASDGIGIAAPQVGVSLRMFVVDLRDGTGPMWFINPSIEILGEARSSMREGCLSVPGAWGMVERAARVRVRFTGMDGKAASMHCDGLLATAVQHENDHLDGILHLDRMNTHEMRSAMTASWSAMQHLPVT